MNLKQQITSDMKIAMKAKDKDRLKAVRSILTAIKQFEVDNRVEPKDSEILKMIQKMVKQRKDSIEQFTKALRDDLIQIERQELEIISEYMPKQLSNSEITTIIATTIDELGATSMADMGKMMGVLKIKLDGRADMGLVNKILRNQLS